MDNKDHLAIKKLEQEIGVKYTIREFIKKFHPLSWPKLASGEGGLKQFSWDLFESIEETLDGSLDFETKIGSIHYTISTALEVYDPNSFDYSWLNYMFNSIDFIYDTRK